MVAADGMFEIILQNMVDLEMCRCEEHHSDTMRIPFTTESCQACYCFEFSKC